MCVLLFVTECIQKEMVRAYNDTFSLDTMNKYFIPPILNKNRNYGSFDGNYYAKKQEKEEAEDSMSGDSAHYVIKVNSPDLQSKKSYVSERRGSYALEPAYPSDIGLSEEPGSDESITPDDPLDDNSTSLHERRVSLGNDKIVLHQVVSVMDGIEEKRESSPSSAFDADVGGDRFEQNEIDKENNEMLKVLDPTKYGGASKSDIDYDSSLPNDNEEDDQYKGLLDVDLISPGTTYVEPKSFEQSSSSEETPQVTPLEDEEKAGLLDEFNKNAIQTEFKSISKKILSAFKDFLRLFP